MENLLARLRDRLTQNPHLQHFYVAYSGGLDSHVLLHLCAQLDLKGRVSAIHINHGLQEMADAWQLHCQQTALQLGIPCHLIKVNARAAKGQSPEEAARLARYAAFKSMLNSNDALLMAHHQDDQLETLLLQVQRGAGLKGLSGMAMQSDLGAGLLLRPLLTTSQIDLKHYAQHQNLNWIEDPSNSSEQFDRNFIRHSIIPLLKQRWPAIALSASRSARHCAEAEQFIQQELESQFTQIYDAQSKSLNLNLLLDKNNFCQRQLVREWLLTLGLRMPSEKQLESLISSMLHSENSRQPEFRHDSHIIRRFQQRLYCEPNSEKPDTDEDHFYSWPSQQTKLVLKNGQLLSWRLADEGIDLEKWLGSKIDIRFRQGGESIALPGRTGHHVLKKLFQEQKLPAWERKTIPLIYLNDQLAAVGQLWISSHVWQKKHQACVKIIHENSSSYPFPTD